MATIIIITITMTTAIITTITKHHRRHDSTPIMENADEKKPANGGRQQLER